MKKLILSLAFSVVLVGSAQAGVFHAVKHLSVDALHVTKWAVVSVAHGVKHAAGDVVTVVK